MQSFPAKRSLHLAAFFYVENDRQAMVVRDAGWPLSTTSLLAFTLEKRGVRHRHGSADQRRFLISRLTWSQRSWFERCHTLSATLTVDGSLSNPLNGLKPASTPAASW